MVRIAGADGASDVSSGSLAMLRKLDDDITEARRAL
jgi:hypothetical protein